MKKLGTRKAHSGRRAIFGKVEPEPTLERPFVPVLQTEYGSQSLCQMEMVVVNLSYFIDRLHEARKFSTGSIDCRPYEPNIQVNGFSMTDICATGGWRSR